MTNPTRLASVLFAVLLAASLVTAALVVRAKTPDLMLELTELPNQTRDPGTGDPLKDPATGEPVRHAFTPNGDGEDDVASFTLFIRDDEPHATVQIVAPFLKVTRTLADDVALEADEPVQYTWDGRTDKGKPARQGRYRIRVLLPTLDREVVDPRRINLVRR